MVIERAICFVILCCSLSCTGSGDRRLLSSTEQSDERLDEPSEDSTQLGRAAMGDESDWDQQLKSPSSNLPPASEVVARAILAERFRGAGLRVRYDVAIGRPGQFQFTADGYDPRSRVGYEYVAAAERDTDLAAAERLVLEGDPEYRILIIDAAPVSSIEEQAARFLAEVQRK